MQSWTKLYRKIWVRVTCLIFLNIEEFYRSCNFVFFWWIFFSVKPYMLYISKSSYDLCKYFRFFLNFSTSCKRLVKEQWPKKSLFQIVWLNFMICALMQKKRRNIFEFLKSWQLTKSTKDTQSRICLQFLVNKSWVEAVNIQS